MHYYYIIALVFAGGAALGTLSLALLAFRDIRRIKREQNNRQLFEIIEWATSAREWDFTEADNTRLQSSKEPWITSWIIISRHLELLMSILRTGHIMDKVALHFKRPSLNEKIRSLLTELINMQMHLADLQIQIDFTAAQTPPKFIASLDRLSAQKSRVRQAAEEVVTETAELI